MLDLFLRVVMSVLGAGTLYSGWLALVLSLNPNPASPISLWLLFTAPVATALGFGLGALIGDRIIRRRPRIRILQAFLWPLAGCIVGAIVVYPFGPMLIVFGMFGLGSAAVVVNNVIETRKAHSVSSST